MAEVCLVLTVVTVNLERERRDSQKGRKRVYKLHRWNDAKTHDASNTADKQRGNASV